MPKTQANAHEKSNYDIVGITITRCDVGTQKPIEEDFFTILFNQYVEGPVLISEKMIKNKIAENDEWLADIESGETCYLKIDAIQVLHDVSDEESQPEVHEWEYPELLDTYYDKYVLYRGYNE